MWRSSQIDTHSDWRAAQADTLRASAFSWTLKSILQTVRIRNSLQACLTDYLVNFKRSKKSESLLCKMATCCFKSDLAISSISIWPNGPRSWCLRGIFANLVKSQLCYFWSFTTSLPHSQQQLNSKENKPDALRPKAWWASAPPAPWRRWSSGRPSCATWCRWPGGRLAVCCGPSSRWCRWPRRSRGRMLVGPRWSWEPDAPVSGRRPWGEAVQHAIARETRERKERKRRK